MRRPALLLKEAVALANFRLTQLANFVDIFKNADVVTGIFDSADDRRLCNGVSGEHAFRRSGLAVIEYSQSPDPALSSIISSRLLSEMIM